MEEDEKISNKRTASEKVPRIFTNIRENEFKEEMIKLQEVSNKIAKGTKKSQYIIATAMVATAFITLFSVYFNYQSHLLISSEYQPRIYLLRNCSFKSSDKTVFVSPVIRNTGKTPAKIYFNFTTLGGEVKNVTMGGANLSLGEGSKIVMYPVMLDGKDELVAAGYATIKDVKEFVIIFDIRCEGYENHTCIIVNQNRINCSYERRGDEYYLKNPEVSLE